MASKQRAGFTAYVYENDYKEIQNLVKQYPIIETGGDLFGLWQDENTVVIQLFIGPGENCQRTTTSFHQEIDYLGKVGGVITKEEGLCNVGEWHSHHQIGMPNPSKSDNETVLSNMPQLNLDRFVLFIASIESSSAKKQKRHRDVKPENIKIRCFMYKEGLHVSRQPIQGEIVLLPGVNPLQRQNKARKIITDGAGAAPELEKEAQDKKPKSSDKEKTVNNESQPQRDVRDENTSPNPGEAQATLKETKEPKRPPPKTQSTQDPCDVRGLAAYGSQNLGGAQATLKETKEPKRPPPKTQSTQDPCDVRGLAAYGSQNLGGAQATRKETKEPPPKTQSTPDPVTATRINGRGFF